MTDVAPADAPLEPGEAEQPLCDCEMYARVTERAALAGARWLGRADQESADRDSAVEMRSGLERLPIAGRIVIGDDEGH